MFSSVAVITPYDGVPTLMFRAANQRRNQILEAQLRVRLMRDEVSIEGQFMRRVYDLTLVRSKSDVLVVLDGNASNWRAKSPLRSYTRVVDKAETSLVVTLSGLDETQFPNIHARHTYVCRDILWNMRL